jgi:hypothetical protein
MVQLSVEAERKALTTLTARSRGESADPAMGKPPSGLELRVYAPAVLQLTPPCVAIWAPSEHARLSGKDRL